MFKGRAVRLWMKDLFISAESLANKHFPFLTLIVLVQFIIRSHFYRNWCWTWPLISCTTVRARVFSRSVSNRMLSYDKRRPQIFSGSLILNRLVFRFNIFKFRMKFALVKEASHLKVRLKHHNSCRVALFGTLQTVTVCQRTALFKTTLLSNLMS